MKTLKTLLFIMIIAANYTGCTENHSDNNDAQDIDDATVSYTDVTLSDFVLPTGYNWQNLQPDSVYLFNSLQELAPYITGTVAVDFEKQSLLTVQGWVTNGIERIDKQWQEISAGEYQLNISIMLNKTMEAPLWTVSILVSKISGDARIELLINGKENIPENISLTGKWKLVGFVNGADGAVTTPEASSRKPYNFYWIQFKEDKTVYGMSSSNLLLGSYDVNLDASEIQIKVGAATEVMEKPDGILFIDRLNSVRSFEYRESALLLYYNETDYLLFEIYDDEKE
jgi:hypothetical protein